MANPPSIKKKANPSARATGKGNNTNGHSASSTSKAKRAITDENADGILAKRQRTGVNGRRPREPQVLSATNSDGTSGAADAIPDGNEILQKYNEMKGYPYMHHKTRILLTLHCPAKYEEEKAARTALEEQLENTGVQGGAKGDKDLVNSIPKPPGTAGKDYSIQIEMGLAGTVKKSEKYKAIQVRHAPDT
jgi:hypothetical protein